MQRQWVLEQTRSRFEKRRRSLHGFAYAFDRGKDRGLQYFDLGTDQLHNVYSVTKTVTGLVLGMVLKIYAVSVETHLSHFFIANSPSEKSWKEITLRQLLTMSSGFEWAEKDHFRSSNLMLPWAQQKDLVKWALERPVSAVPGTAFNYDSLNSHILSGVIHAITGKPIQAFAESCLFEPLGIAHTFWETDSEGLGFGGHGLYMTLEGMLKLGEGLLNRDLMHRWVGESYYRGLTEPAFKVPSSSYGYGYHTWTGVLHGNPYFGAFGHGGQRIIILPDKGVLTTFGKIWPEFGPLDSFFEEWLVAERDV